MKLGKAIVLVALGLGSLALLPGCFSMKKTTVEERLLALEKNAPLRGRVQTLERRVTIGGEELAASFRYFRAGSSGPDRPVIVLVHGTPSSMVTWTASVLGPDGLAEDCDVYALEMVGHGTTRTELERYDFERGAEWIQAFLEALDLRGVTLVGNSYGGEFAWRAALDDPQRVARLVLMSSSGFPRRDDEWLPEEVKMRELSLAKIGWLLNSRERVRGALAPHFQTPVPDEHVEEVYLVCSNRDNWHAMIDLARDENGLRSPELAALQQPTLLLWGAQDVAYRPERFGALFRDTIPRARLELLAGAGHYPQEEQPAAVARAIADFAREE
ncbi:MAG TPA: alpha/beta hydrolase [Planctomycetota bacterium]